MATTALKGNPVSTCGDLPNVGDTLPSFTVVGSDLSAIDSATMRGQWTVLNIFPSIDTPTCATSARTFNKELDNLEGVAVYNISADLPFAQKRFCAAEGLASVQNASTFRSDASDVLGVTMTDGPLQGLCARAVIVVSPEGVVTHTELVGEIADEPNYQAALSVITK